MSYLPWILSLLALALLIYPAVKFLFLGADVPPPVARSGFKDFVRKAERKDPP